MLLFCFSYVEKSPHLLQLISECILLNFYFCINISFKYECLSCLMSMLF